MHKSRKIQSAIPIVKEIFKNSDKGDLGEILKNIERIENLQPEDMKTLKEYSKTNILKKLKIEDAYEIQYITDQIKSPWEYFLIEKTFDDLIKNLKGAYENITSTERHEKKRKFDRTKKRILKDLKSIGIESGIVVNEIMEKEYSFSIIEEALQKKFILKVYKKALCLDLIDLIGVGKNRAKEISKIIDYFPQ